MKRRDFLFAAATVFAMPAALVRRARADAALYAELLNASVKPDGKGYNQVDYAMIAANKKALSQIVTSMEDENPSMMEDDAAKAFWINLYNAATLKVVADNYPVASIKDIDLGSNGLFGTGPWSDRFMLIEGDQLSLDDIENKKLRKQFNDPLVHYGLNCASRSCPNLAAKPYEAATLSDDLKANASAYVNHPRGVDIREEGIVASKIYSWYAKDFGGKSRLKAHWQEFTTPEKAALIAPAKIANYEYDWSLNNV